MKKYKLNKYNLNKADGFLFTAQKMKFSIKDSFSKCDQIIRKLGVWSHQPEEILNGKLNFLRSVSDYE